MERRRGGETGRLGDWATGRLGDYEKNPPVAQSLRRPVAQPRATPIGYASTPTRRSDFDRALPRLPGRAEIERAMSSAPQGRS